MACPHVAGCAALLLQANPSLTPMQVRTIFQNTADHNTPTEKAGGDRGQDPYGIDPNYDPGCGYGLIDVYAAAKEALNSVSGVQVVQVKGVALPAQGRIDFSWITQREYSFLGFNVRRAPDVNGAPGTFTQLNGALITPAGDPDLEGDDNRTAYVWADSDPALTIGQQYWYQVEWVDLASGAHAEPPVPVAFGQLARVATAFYQIVHNAVDNDLLVRIGFDLDYDPGNLGDATFEVLGPGESQQDSAVVLVNGGPANTAPATAGTVEHYWSVGFRQGDGMEVALPPRRGLAWFLRVTDAGYVNRGGRVTAFSLFVNDSPGSPSGTTYVTDHLPMPQPMSEGGVVPATLWIPEQSTTAVAAAQFAGSVTATSAKLVLTLLRDTPGATAQVFRSRSEDFAGRQLLTPEPLLIRDQRLEYEDASVDPDASYWYWVALREPDGRTIMNGPLELRLPSRTAVTVTRTPYPNPVSRGTAFEYAIGAEAARGGDADVAITVHDLQGRVVRTLERTKRAAGVYRGEWNATDDHGARVPGGMYVMRFRAGSASRNVKVSVVN